MDGMECVGWGRCVGMGLHVGGVGWVGEVGGMDGVAWGVWGGVGGWVGYMTLIRRHFMCEQRQPVFARPCSPRRIPQHLDAAH